MSYRSYSAFARFLQPLESPSLKSTLHNLLLRQAEQDAGFNDAVQAFIGAFTAGGKGSEKALQASFVSAAHLAQVQLRKPTLSLRNTCSRALIGRRKPDVSAVLSSSTRSDTQITTLDVVCIGELKNDRSASFQQGDVGQLLSIMLDLARLQAQLRDGEGGGDSFKVLGFLCSWDVIQFFLMSVGHVDLEVASWASVGPLGMGNNDAGMRALVSLMCVQPGQLGYDVPVLRLLPVHGRGAATSAADDEVTDLQCSGYLGRGATACCYLAGGREQDLMVAKVFMETGHAEHELTVLKAIRAAATARGIADPPFVLAARDTLVDAVSRMHAPTREALLLAPLGAKTFFMPTAQQEESGIAGMGLCIPSESEFCDLVDALLLLHACGYVHRDPRPENFYRTAGGRFVLGDFGMAAPTGKAYDWSVAHSLRYGPLAALAYKVDGGDDEPTHGCAEDYEQVARLVYAKVTKMAIPVPKTDLNGSYRPVLDAWEAVSSQQSLVALVEPAHAAGAAVQAAFESFAQAGGAGGNVLSEALLTRALETAKQAVLPFKAAIASAFAGSTGRL